MTMPLASSFLFISLAVPGMARPFSDNARESGCDKSCLRKDRSSTGFDKAKQEMAALDAAVLEVG